MSIIHRAERLQLIEDYRKSNLTAAQWCREKGFKTDKLYRLLQTERNYVKRQNSDKENLSLIPVLVEENVTFPESVLEIAAGKFKIKVRENTDWNLLSKTLLLLKSVC